MLWSSLLVARFRAIPSDEFSARFQKVMDCMIQEYDMFDFSEYPNLGKIVLEILERTRVILQQMKVREA